MFNCAFFEKGKRFLALISVGLLLCQAGFTLAGQATPAYDILSAISVSQFADHEIRFKMPNGIDEPTDTVRINLPDFVFGSVSLNDIDFTYGPTGVESQAVLAGASGAGVWGVGIAGNVITFSAPTDAVPGTVPAGDDVIIKIGLNAGGVHRLQNPANPVVAQITINGTFGGWNVIAVPILDNDSLSVTAVVPGEVVTSTPPVEPPTPPSVQAPVISNVQVINLTSNSATIIWNTDKPADSMVFYGLTSGYASGTVSDSLLVTNHSLTLNGLSESTLYHFKVKSTDNVPLSAESADLSFTTLGDVTAPLISNIQVKNITDTTALVTWDTNEPASSLVNYGVTTAYGSQSSVVGQVTSHAVLLSGLTPGTTYHFEVSSTDSAGNTATVADGVFTTTIDITPPANIQNLQAVPGDKQVSLTWNNPPDPDFAGTKILRKTEGYPTGPNDGTLVYQGSGVATLDTGLTNGTLYYYAAFAYDTKNNFASGALAAATPVGPVVPPLPPVPTSTPPIPPVPTSTPPTPPQPPLPPLPPIPPVVEPPTPGVQPPAQAVQISAQYFAENGKVELVPDAAGNFGALKGSAVSVFVPLSGLGSLPETLTVSVGNSLYNLALSANGTEYIGSFVVPDTGKYPIVVTAIFKDGTMSQVLNTLFSQPWGLVLVEPWMGEPTEPVEGAEVQLFRDENGNWSKYAAPQSSGQGGVYGFIVPNGRYYAEVVKGGFRKKVTNPLYIEKNVFNQTISLIKEPVAPILPPEAPVAEKIEVATKAALENIGYTVKITKEVLSNPEVQRANAIASPSLLAVSLVNVASSFSIFNFLAYFQYLFTQPILLFGRTRRRKWGVVYNSLSKQPVDLAVVRLVHFETRLVVQTAVSDRYGRYRFLAKAGKYFIEIVKPGYTFPSRFLADKNEDIEFTDLYHGAALDLQESDVIALNVPVDPAVREETPKRVLWHDFVRLMRKSFALSGIALGIIIVVIQPNLANIVMFLVQIGLYFMFKRLGMPAKSKKWGLILDAKTHKPVANAIVRIFDKKFNKLLETQVTGNNGTYGFFVRRNVYYVTAEKQGYMRHVSHDIDLLNKDEALIDQNISLEPVGKPLPPTPQKAVRMSPKPVMMKKSGV